MAYADYNFYVSQYFGDTIPFESSKKWLERASDAVDTLTFGRLNSAFPTVDSYAVKVKKAVCAIADALYLVDAQSLAASVQQAPDGSYHGAVKSVSSGRESISYDSATSAYAIAATSNEALSKLISSIAVGYLANIPDGNGINLLYAGGDAFVR